MLFRMSRGLKFCKQRQRLGCLTALLIGKRKIHLRAAVARLHGQRFFKFAYARAGSPQPHQHRAQSTVPLLRRRRKTHYIFKISQRRLQIVMRKRYHARAIVRVGLLQTRRWLLRKACQGKG